ncbi:putative glycerol kinase 5 [Teleopsis dalmanni]|uniref:putative glycerol kinase 5 n=1 Tax=Teleopsis dalmanni TaxID=139649 RepID=UPI0018CE2209|nr:putative glycerol kinase 5 [Teleopsis dalmanni]
MAAYIAALDVGTTTVRCFIIKSCNGSLDIQGSASELVTLINPQPGYFEIEPETLWLQIVRVINGAVKDAQLKPSQITCLTLSTQRCTFLTWNHRTKEYYHNFITWKDLRSDTLVDQWNSGLKLQTMNKISYGLYLITRSKRFLAGSVLKMMNGQVTLRLLYEIENNIRLQQALKQKTARVELLDSWILYKLRSGNGLDCNVEHITDITSCTATGLFDPFTLSWSSMIKLVFGIDVTLLPKIVDNAYKHFGNVHPAALGADWQNTEIPISSSISDQTASIWGSQCFEEGDVKITIGTGAFLNTITGKSCHASIMGLYPLVAWQFKKKISHTLLPNTIFCVEGAAHDMGTVISWAQACGLFTDPFETAAIAESVEDTCDVFFIPAFSGLGPPINDHKATSGFIGITPSTKRAHLVRAVLESIVFRLVQLCETTEKETKYKIKLLRVDGGVSRNNFVCQFLADASGKKVERSQNAESSIMGATYMAGLNYGLWDDLESIRKFRKIDRIFEPDINKYISIKRRISVWNKAIERFGNWY